MDLDDAPEPPVEVVEMGMSADMADVAQLEEDLFHQVSVILTDAMKFRDIAPDAEAPPVEWIRAIGLAEAEKRFRIAKAAWASAKDAPAGLKLAKDAMVGMVRARATRDQGPRVLNATLIQTSAPMPVFPERIVDK